MIVAFIIYSLNSLSLILETFLGNRTLGGDEGRTISWTFALNAVLGSPIFGYGLEGWKILSEGTSYIDYLHNIFLELLLDYGFLGLTVFIAVFFSGINRVKKEDRLFIFLFMFVTAFPLLFQNGLTEVNLWRCLILNRIAINYSQYSQTGITGLFKCNYA